MFAKQIALAGAALLLSAGASAQVGITADLGTTGVGAHLVVPMETYLNGRFGINGFKHDFSKTSGSIAYDVQGKLQTVDILFDWYLREGSSFHLTGGVIYNGNRLDAHAKPNANGTFALNNTGYTAANIGGLNGTVDYRKAAPYIGIGWGNPLAGARNGRGWSFTGDLGVFYMGNPNVKLTSWSCSLGTTACATLLKDIEVERLKLQDDFDNLKVFPVLRASVSYAF